MELRQYQREAIDATWHYFKTNTTTNPCIVIPTGGGKTPVIAAMCKEVVDRWCCRVLIVAHRKELLEQTADKIHRTDPKLDFGIYSAGLKKRDKKNPIIIGGIQSIHNKAFDIGPFDLVLIDEAHMIPHSGDGMYQTLLKDLRTMNPKMRVVGLTATPYRLDVGLICDPDHFLNDICYEVGVKDLIEKRYLCQVRTKGTSVKADLTGVHVRGGEFIAGELEDAMASEELVSGAVQELLAETVGRHSCLIFTSGVRHGEMVKEEIKNSGHKVEIVTGTTPSDERARILKEFQDGELPYLVNIDVLTTGFDAQNIDTIVMLRATLSPGLYYQMVGRGFRTHFSKQECLILDFAGNVERHGPVDAIDPGRKGSQANGEAVMKMCPECKHHVHASQRVCSYCGHEFPEPELKHATKATGASILSEEIHFQTLKVMSTTYHAHYKQGAPEGAPRTLRCEYDTAWNQRFKHWVCIEHDQPWVKKKAMEWWSLHCNEQMPDDVDYAIDLIQAGAFADVYEITVKMGGGSKYPEVVEWKCGRIPNLMPFELPPKRDEPEAYTDPIFDDGDESDGDLTL